VDTSVPNAAAATTATAAATGLRRILTTSSCHAFPHNVDLAESASQTLTLK
jgi:hypothetical protein